MRAVFHLLFGLSLCAQAVPSQAVTVEEMLRMVLGWYQPYVPQELFALLNGQFVFPTATPTQVVVGATPTPSQTLAPTPTSTQGQSGNPYRGTWNVLVSGAPAGGAAGGVFAICPAGNQVVAPHVVMGFNLQLGSTRWEGTLNQAGVVTNGQIFPNLVSGSAIGTWSGTFTPTTGPFGNFNGNWSIRGTGTGTCSGVRSVLEVTLPDVCP